MISSAAALRASSGFREMNMRAVFAEPPRPPPVKPLTVSTAGSEVMTFNGFTGGGRGGSANTARMFISLKPLDERKASAGEIIARLRPKLARISGATLFLTASQDLRVGGRQSNAEYQFTMRSDSVQDLTN